MIVCSWQKCEVPAGIRQVREPAKRCAGTGVCRWCVLHNDLCLRRTKRSTMRFLSLAILSGQPWQPWQQAQCITSPHVHVQEQNSTLTGCHFRRILEKREHPAACPASCMQGGGGTIIGHHYAEYQNIYADVVCDPCRTLSMGPAKDLGVREHELSWWVPSVTGCPQACFFEIPEVFSVPFSTVRALKTKF